MIKIDNLRNTRDGIRCDRQSKLGNPFYLVDENSRDLVCEAYQIYFDLIIQNEAEPKKAIEQVKQQFSGLKFEYKFKLFSRAEILEKLASINRDSTLLCWCAPKRCHCETIKQYIEGKP